MLCCAVLLCALCSVLSILTSNSFYFCFLCEQELQTAVSNAQTQRTTECQTLQAAIEQFKQETVAKLKQIEVRMCVCVCLCL